MIKIFPEIIFRAIHSNKPGGAFRVWFIAKDFNSGGCGAIPAKAFRAASQKYWHPQTNLFPWAGAGKYPGFDHPVWNLLLADELAGWRRTGWFGEAKKGGAEGMLRERFLKRGI